MCSQMILIAAVSGTASKMPTIPHSQPQKIIDTNTTSVDKSRECAMTRGSITLPIVICTTVNPMRHTNPGVRCSNWRNAMMTGGMTAMIDPTFGIKLSKNAIVPQSSGNSTPIIHVNKLVQTPVAKLITVLVIM